MEWKMMMMMLVTPTLGAILQDDPVRSIPVTSHYWAKE